MRDKANKHAEKLLAGKEPASLYGDIGFTRDEELYSRVSHERMIEFIKTYPVVEVSEGTNNYGEFQFIYCRVTRYCYDGSPYDDCLTFYGNGYHEYRGVVLVNWSFFCGNGFLVKDKKAMAKKEVIRLINSKRAALGIPHNAKQQSSGNMFELLADMTDEDGAYTELFQ